MILKKVIAIAMLTLTLGAGMQAVDSPEAEAQGYVIDCYNQTTYRTYYVYSGGRWQTRSYPHTERICRAVWVPVHSSPW